MVSAKVSLQKLIRTRLLWGAVVLLLVLTRWAHLEFRSLHNLTAYRALNASQVGVSSPAMLAYSGAFPRAGLGGRTLWLMGRYHLYNDDPVRASVLLSEAAQSLTSDYQVHRDLLYAYGGAGRFEDFVREYERGETMRRSLQGRFASGDGLAGRVDALSIGSFDVENPRSLELVLLGYIHSVDASLEEGAIETAVSRLVLLEKLFDGNLLVLSRIHQTCQVRWNDALCSGASPDALRKSRWRAWEDSRLTAMISEAALQLHDQGVWTEKDLLSLARYLVWQHALEEEAVQFLDEVSARGLDDTGWSELSGEMALRRERAASGSKTKPEEVSTVVEYNLLAPPSTLFDDMQAGYLSLGRQKQRWRLEVHDAPPYSGGSYVGGIDDHACPNGESALRIDGLWQDSSEGGPGAWAGFESNKFTLQPGAEYELSLAFRVSHPLPKVTVEFFPADLFGPDQQSYRLVLVEGKWFLKQRLTVWSQSDVSAQLRVTYSGYGPLRLCEPRLVCKDCAQPARAVRPLSQDYQVHLSEPSLHCQDCSLIADYQAHRDLLYVYDEAGEFEEFVREYERGEGIRQMLRGLIASGGEAVRQFLQDSVAPGSELPVRAEVLSSGGFDVQNPGSQELVLVNYLRSIDASLREGDAETSGSRLVFVQGLFDRDLKDLLVLPRVYQACQMHWEDALCSEMSPDTLREFRLQAWEDARLTGMIASPALQLYDQGLWTETELLSLGRYLVWQHALEAETAHFLSEVSARGLSSPVWSELSEEMTWRKELAALGTAMQGEEPLAQVKSNLLADPSQWHLEIRDALPYSGGSYVGGIDDHACPNGENALRIDGLWLGPRQGGPGAWAGFESNSFTLQPGAEYELCFVFRVSHSHPHAWVHVKFLPADVSGQELYRLALEEGKWSVMQQRLTVRSQNQVTARLIVMFRGHGPFWLCEPSLVCKDCTQP